METITKCPHCGKPLDVEGDGEVSCTGIISLVPDLYSVEIDNEPDAMMEACPGQAYESHEDI